MRISDWSSDVCSSDLHAHGAGRSHTDTRRTRCVAADPSQSVEQFAQKALAAALMFPLVAVLPAMTAIFGYSKTNAAQRPRSEERRVGKECVSTCRTWWSLYH